MSGSGSGGPGEEFPAAEVHASMKIVRKESRHARKISDDPMRIDIRVEDKAPSSTDESSRVVTPDERLKALMNPDEDRKRSESPPPKWPRIAKVPRMLRGNKTHFKKQFEPRVVSLGPYHHHKSELKPAEDLKRRLAKQFIEEVGEGAEVLYKKIETEVPELRKCYDKRAVKRYSDEELAWMMMVDGCSLLQYIYCRNNTDCKSRDLLPMKDQNAGFVQQDLFLLENQLPFRVLELLLESRFKMEKGRMEIVEKFVTRMTGYPAQVENARPAHLLDLMRSSLLGCPKQNKKGAATDGGGSGSAGWNSFRSVSELKTAGVHFKPSKSGCLRDISFTSYLFFGVLRLPRIMVDDATKSRFLNLIAFEMSSEPAIELDVTSYMCFLDSLIDYPEDVKELRRQSVLLNLMGSDEVVATMFNQIATDFVVDSEAYKGVMEAIQRHYDKKLSTWITEGFHNHFSSPWTVLAFLAALLALFLSAVQTWFSVFSPDPCSCRR